MSHLPVLGWNEALSTLALEQQQGVEIQRYVHGTGPSRLVAVAGF
jgi:hypothetical protein